MRHPPLSTRSLAHSQDATFEDAYLKSVNSYKKVFNYKNVDLTVLYATNLIVQKLDHKERR